LPISDFDSLGLGVTQWDDKEWRPKMPSSKKTRFLTEMELIKHAHSDHAAAEALNRCDEIRARGRKPVITYSDFNGYRVFDNLEIKPQP
jgi:hypothetical protein